MLWKIWIIFWIQKKKIFVSLIYKYIFYDFVVNFYVSIARLLEEVITFWERSGSYSEYKKKNIPNFQKWSLMEVCTLQVISSY